MNVLSLFDGMRCLAMALQRSNIKIDKYYSSEIDKHANKAGRVVYPQAVELGDVTKWREWDIDWSSIDLVAGGSPCQGFSFAGKQLAFDDPRSKLFFEFVNILNYIKSVNPQVKFLLENVRMKKEYIAIISHYMGVEPIPINSNLVSAQNRYRLYWTNIEGVEQPEDKGIFLKDIVHERADLKYNAGHSLIMGYKGGNQLNPDYKSQANTIHDRDGKSGTLCAGTHGYANGYVMSEGWCRWWKKKAEYQLKKRFSALNPDKAITMTARQYSNWNGNFIMEETGRSFCLMVPEATKKGYAEVEVGDGVDLTFIGSKTRRGRLMKDKSNCLTATPCNYCMLEGLAEYIVPFDKTLKILDKEVAKGKIGYFRKDSQANRVYYVHDKAITLCGDAGGGAAKMGQYLFGCITKRVEGVSINSEGDTRPHKDDKRKSGLSEIGTVRNIEGNSKSATRIASHKQYVHSNIDHLFGCISPDRIDKRQNGQRFNIGQKFYTLTAQDKHGVLIEGYIRKLTPIECGRLQTVDDEIIIAILESGVSETQVYKMLGNGMTVDVISHILNNLKQEHKMPNNEENKIKDLTIDTEGYDNKEPNCELAIKGRMKERNPDPKSSSKSSKTVVNGVTMPTRKSASKRVWEISNYLSEIAQAPAKKEDVWGMCQKEGITLTTAKRNHSQWRKFYGADAVPEITEPEMVITGQTGVVEASEMLVDGTEEIPQVASIPDTSFDTKELEKGMPTAPPSMVENRETPEWMKAPVQEAVPDIETPPNGWGVKEAKEVVEQVNVGLDGVDLSGFMDKSHVKVVRPEDLSPEVTGAKPTFSILDDPIAAVTKSKEIKVGEVLIVETKTEQLTRGQAEMNKIKATNDMKRAINHVLSMGRIHVYTTQNLSDVTEVILSLIGDNPEQVRAFLDTGVTSVNS